MYKLILITNKQHTQFSPTNMRFGNNILDINMLLIYRIEIYFREVILYIILYIIILVIYKIGVVFNE